MADVEIRGVERVRLKLKGIKSFKGSKLLLEEIGRGIVERILLRTSRGVDVTGSSFTPYSLSYKKQRESVGLQVDDVDLFFTGSMLAAMTYTASKTDVKIFFRPTAGTEVAGQKSTLASDEKALFNQERRDFFGMSSDDVEWATNLARDWVRTLLGKR